MRTSITALCVITLACGAACGAPLQRGDISSDAKWVFHFDWDGFRASDLGKICAKMRQGEPLIEQRIEAATQMLGFNPIQDIASITAYGSTYEHGAGVAVIKGAIPEDKLTTLLAANESHRTQSYGESTLHTWTDPRTGKARAACFYRANMVILSQHEDEVRKAIDVMANTHKSLAGPESAIPLPDVAPSVFLVAHASKCEGQLSQHTKTRMFQNADDLTVAFGEENGNTVFEAQVKASTEEKADLMRTGLEGMIAFLALGAEQNPVAAKLAQALQVQREGQSLKVGMTMPVNELQALVMEQLKVCEERHMRIREHIEEETSTRE